MKKHLGINIWTLAPEFKQKVRDSWEGDILGTKTYHLVGKSNRLKRPLKELYIERFGEVEMKVDRAKEGLMAWESKMQLDHTNVSLINEEIRLAQEYSNCNKAKEHFLKQKCKIQWLKEGDQIPSSSIII